MTYSTKEGLQVEKSVKIWLIIGLVMVFFQVVIGGITRLTGSGLSITKWEIVTGALPPTSEAIWNIEFDKYKATPQYEKINYGMSLSEFKFIYFWEYFHRFWARLMGLVFAIPFIIFWRKEWIPTSLMRRLGIVVLMAAVVASFGWIMVASGLINRPWVSAYKLTIHLSLAFVLFSYLLWTIFHVYQPNKKVIHNSTLKKWALWITSIAFIQIMLGGLMSGMKAGLVAATFPDINGNFIPVELFRWSNWSVDNFMLYESTAFVPLLVQVLHRSTAYLLTVIILAYFWKARKVELSLTLSRANMMLVTMLVTQFLLGVFTLINCVGAIPVTLGVFHQGGALILLGIALGVNYQYSDTRLY